MSNPVYAVNGPGVVGESVDGEALIVNLETGCYYSARGTAEAIWSAIAPGADIGRVIEILSGGYDAAHGVIAADVARFVGQLVDEGLVRVADTRADSALSTPSAKRQAWATPELERFTDMQALLLLDPIHEVDETGWPRPAWQSAPADPRGLH